MTDDLGRYMHAHAWDLGSLLRSAAPTQHYQILTHGAVYNTEMRHAADFKVVVLFYLKKSPLFRPISMGPDQTLAPRSAQINAPDVLPCQPRRV